MLPLLSPKSKIPQNYQVQLTSLPGRPSRAQKWSPGLALGCLRGENPNSDFSRDEHGLSRGRKELSSGSQHPHFPGLLCSPCSVLLQRLDGVSAVPASSSVAVGWRGKLSSPHTHTQPKEACPFGLKRQLIWSYKHLLLMAVEITAHRRLSQPSINSAASRGSSQARSHLSQPPGHWALARGLLSSCASVTDAAVLHLCLGSAI